MNPPFVFAVPVIGRHAAEDWETVLACLRGTLTSLLNQSDPDFRVLVACNDELSAPELSDPLVEVHRLERRILDTREARAPDATGKRRAMALRAHAISARYLMFVDADDLVSRRVVEYARHVNAPNGYVVESGYIMNALTGWIASFPGPAVRVPSFDRFCGTSRILSLPAIGTPEGLLAETTIGHHDARQWLIDQGRPAHDIPFPAVIYLLNTGVNLSQVHPKTSERLTFITRVVDAIATDGRIPTHAERREFALPIAAAARDVAIPGA